MKGWAREEKRGRRRQWYVVISGAGQETSASGVPKELAASQPGEQGSATSLLGPSAGTFRFQEFRALGLLHGCSENHIRETVRTKQ